MLRVTLKEIVMFIEVVSALATKYDFIYNARIKMFDVL